MVQVPSGSPQGLDASGLLRLKDGGGIHSTADWYLPKGKDVLAELRSQFLDCGSYYHACALMWRKLAGSLC